MSLQSASTKRKYKDCSTVTEQLIDNELSQKENLNVENKSSKKKKRNRFTFEEKEKILQELSVQPLDLIIKKYEISERLLRNWRKHKNEIIELSKNKNCQGMKKIPQKNDLDDELYLWFINALQKGFPITGPILKAKAKEINAHLGGPENFLASDGWLTKWKKRKNVKNIKITGEKLSADSEAAEEYKSTFKKILVTKNLTRAQCFNFDESGVQYKQVPNKTHAPKEVSQVSGTKKQLQRVTVAACCNADGSCKLPLVVIGAAKNPRCFKSLNKKNLPVFYQNQQNAWMSKEIFEEWFTNEFVPRVERFLVSKNLPLIAVLFIDNCKAHKFLKIGNIEVAFFPPNVTSLIQPLDQGILQALKLNYQYFLATSILTCQRQNILLIDHLKTIDIKQAIEWIAAAWEKLEPKTIYKCWKALWPVEKCDAETQTDDNLSCSDLCLLDASASEVANDIELQNNNHLIDLLQLVKQIDGYEELDKDTLLNWMNKVEPVSQEEWSNDEIIEQVQNTTSEQALQESNFEEDGEDFLSNFLSTSYDTLYGKE